MLNHNSQPVRHRTIDITELAILGERFPLRLMQLGFRLMQVVDAAGLDLYRYVIPPVCDVPAGPFLMGENPLPESQKADENARVYDGEYEYEYEEKYEYMYTYEFEAKDENMEEYPGNGDDEYEGGDEGEDIYEAWGEVGYEDEDYGESPQHEIVLPAFQIGKYPVTVAEYACAVQAGVVREPEQYGGPFWPEQLQCLDHPVVYVSWHDARAYANWLASIMRSHWRLPTEAEWEKAARGPGGLCYPWGDQWGMPGENAPKYEFYGTTPVGSYPHAASPYKVQDLLGQVFEWCSSWYWPYPYRNGDGREDLQVVSNRRRVMRGCPVRDAKVYAALRAPEYPERVDNVNGMRLALSVG